MYEYQQCHGFDNLSINVGVNVKLTTGIFLEKRLIADGLNVSMGEDVYEGGDDTVIVSVRYTQTYWHLHICGMGLRYVYSKNPFEG